MAGKGRVVYYSTEETLRAVLEGQSDESELEASDSSDVESDHLSDPSDHSDTESAPTLPNDENARNQVDVPPEPQNEPRRGRGRGRNRGQARGRGQPVQVAGGEEDIAQDVLIAKNGTVWQGIRTTRPPDNQPQTTRPRSPDNSPQPQTTRPQHPDDQPHQKLIVSIA